MARAAGLKSIPRKKKAERQTKNESYFINKKFLGSEYEYEVGHELSNSELMTSLNWYSNMETVEESKEYVLEWLKVNNDSRFKSFQKAKRYSQTAGWLARLLSLGYKIPDNSFGRMNQWIDEACLSSPDNDNDDAQIITLSSNRRPNELLNKIVDQLDDIIFYKKYKESGFSLYILLTTVPHTKKELEQVKSYIAPLIAEYKELYGSRDPQMLEGYRHYSRTNKREAAAFFSDIEEDMRRFEGIVRVTSKPRKKRKQTPDAILKRFQYKKEDTNLQIKSIDPKKMLEATEIILYNTKTRIVTFLYGKGSSKLTVRNSFIEDFDEDRSFAKHLGRKFKEYLDKLIFGTKASAQKVSIELFDKTRKLSNRSTPDVIILKAY